MFYYCRSLTLYWIYLDPKFVNWRGFLFSEIRQYTLLDRLGARGIGWTFTTPRALCSPQIRASDVLTSTNEKPELELQHQGSTFIKLQYKENSFQPGATYGQDITNYPRQIKKTSFNICPVDFSGLQTDNNCRSTDHEQNLYYLK